METKRIPDVTFKTRSRNIDTGDFEWQHPTTADYFGGKRVVVFSLPGAFTPTCSNFQVPGYEARFEDFKAEGIDNIYCISCNDSFVMNAWLQDQRVKNVEFIPDGSCEFTAGMDMIVNDGVVEKMFVEPGKSDDCETDPYGETSPETVLDFLRGA